MYYDAIRRARPPTPPPMLLCRHPIQLRWSRSHPERGKLLPSEWDHNQWDIFLSDGFGGLRPLESNPDFPTLQRFAPRPLGRRLAT